MQLLLYTALAVAAVAVTVGGFCAVLAHPRTGCDIWYYRFDRLLRVKRCSLDSVVRWWEAYSAMLRLECLSHPPQSEILSLNGYDVYLAAVCWMQVHVVLWMVSFVLVEALENT